MYESFNRSIEYDGENDDGDITFNISYDVQFYFQDDGVGPPISECTIDERSCVLEFTKYNDDGTEETGKLSGGDALSLVNEECLTDYAFKNFERSCE